MIHTRTADPENRVSSLSDRTSRNCIMTTENLADNPGTGYNTFEPPPYVGPKEQPSHPANQYYPAPPSCKYYCDKNLDSLPVM